MQILHQLNYVISNHTHLQSLHCNFSMNFPTARLMIDKNIHCSGLYHGISNERFDSGSDFHFRNSLNFLMKLVITMNNFPPRRNIHQNFHCNSIVKVFSNEPILRRHPLALGNLTLYQDSSSSFKKECLIPFQMRHSFTLSIFLLLTQERF